MLLNWTSSNEPVGVGLIRFESQVAGISGKILIMIKGNVRGPFGGRVNGVNIETKNPTEKAINTSKDNK